MEFFPEIEISPAAAEAIAAGLFAIAKADGVHEREVALIASFWSESGGGAQALAELQRRGPISPADLAAALPSERERALFVKTALLLGWSDGKLSPNETRVIEDYAAALGVDSATVERLEGIVKEFLLDQISHLANTDAARKVAKELKV